jgi:hypothetical protein
MNIVELQKVISLLPPKAAIYLNTDAHECSVSASGVIIYWYNSEDEHNIDYNDKSMKTITEQEDGHGVYKMFSGKKYYLIALISGS